MFELLVVEFVEVAVVGGGGALPFVLFLELVGAFGEGGGKGAGCFHVFLGLAGGSFLLWNVQYLMDGLYRGFQNINFNSNPIYIISIRIPIFSGALFNCMLKLSKDTCAVFAQFEVSLTNYYFEICNKLGEISKHDEHQNCFKCDMDCFYSV